MPLKHRRWCDPPEPDDGLRVLITRFRPRGLPKAKETWDVWHKELGPSAPLLAAFHGKEGGPLTLIEYGARYLMEMRAQAELIASLAEQVQRGETVTLLCSKDCVIPQACHRTLLALLIEQARG
jgi:uncharacterized protein YeaO (DUF488 family)